MTTLPQNTPLRAPRPADMPVPAMPYAGPGVTQGQAQFGPADIWRVVRGHVWLILSLLIISGTIGFFVNGYLARHYSRFTARGLVQVIQPENTNPLVQQQGLDRYALEAEQKTQAQLLRQEALFSSVLSNPDSPIRTTSWWIRNKRDPQLAKKSLQENFSAGIIPETRLISVSMTDSSPEDATAIVREVVDAHLRNQASIDREQEFEKNNSLTTIKNRIDLDLRNVERERTDLTRQLASAGSLADLNEMQMKLSSLMTSLGQQQTSVQTLNLMIEQLEGALQRGEDPPMVVQQVEQDPRVQQLQQTINGTELTLVNMRARMGDETRTIRTLEAQLERQTQELAELKAERLAEMKISVPQNLRTQLESAQKSLAETQGSLEDFRRSTGPAYELSIRLQQVNSREQRLREELKIVNDQLLDTQTKLGADRARTVSWIQLPSKPDAPSFPVLSGTLAMAMLIGLSVALAIAFLREFLDTTIKSPRDLARVGPMPLLGMVPHEDDDPQTSGAKLPLVIAEAPHSATAEQLRQVRTRLQHSASLDTTRSILVTSPQPGDGKTTISANLAAGLALVGRRILLVDANFRRPELAKLFGVDNSQGFSTVLTAPDTLTAVAKPTSVPNLSVLAAGPKPSNATEMLESQLLIDFIDRAMEHYDHVIFDSGPILFTSEAVAMAPRVDGVVCVLRARGNTRGVVSRLRDTLRQIKAELVGVVLNGVRAHGGGYYARNIRTYYEYSGSGK